MQNRSPNGSGMQGLSPMATNPGMTTMSPGNPAMMMQPPLQRTYSGGSMPIAYGAPSPMPAAPGTPTSQQQQQRLLQLQLQQAQQQQQQLMQLQQQQQQAANMAVAGDPSSQSKFQPIVPQQQQQPSGSPSSMQRTSDLPSPSSSEMLQLQRMQQTQKPSFQRSPSNSGKNTVSFQRRESGGSVTSMPSFQRSASNASSGGSSAAAARKEVQLKPEQVQQLLAQCNSVDKIIYVSKQLLGGSTVNGFLRSTAAAQRIKRQRARQVTAALKKENPEAAKQRKRDLPDQQQEEELKREAFNVRTAKRIKTEMEGGLAYCANLHATIVSILAELDPSGNLPPLLDGVTHPVPIQIAAPAASPPIQSTARAASPQKTLVRPGSNPSSPGDRSPGDGTGSTLRKLRKRKFSQRSTAPKLSEYDDSGKRKLSKKEQSYRIVEILRFRALREGDYVAARVSSRDLWILARVLKDYSAAEVAHKEFLKLSEAKRDSLFRAKVSIKDVEEKDGGSATSVARNLVLPLPRTYAEAAEWGTRCKKGTRVYAMYPNTTSLYSATVMDNTTYCRGEDDVIVVEFDGDESDPITGALPQYHIPARFVTMIPREFPASQTTKKKRASTVLPPKGTRRSNKNSKQHKRHQSDDTLNDMLNEMSHGAFPADGSLDNFEQLEMGAFTQGPRGGGMQAPMPPEPGSYRRKS